MSFESAYWNYRLKGVELAQQYAARAQELYGQCRERIEEVEAPARDRVQQIMVSWQKALSEAGNGDDAQQRAASAWLDHARQYGQALSDYQGGVAKAGKEMADQFESVCGEMQQKARDNYAAFLGELQQLASSKTGNPG